MVSGLARITFGFLMMALALAGSAGANGGATAVPPDVQVQADLSRAAKILLYGQGEGFKSYLSAMLKRLSITGDAPRMQIAISASPEANAYATLHQQRIEVLFGLLDQTADEDELAAVLAHEMTHNNPEQLKAITGDPAIESVLESIAAGKGLQASQREELRADLGAVDRMIKGGYNPWGAYRYHERLAAWYAHQFRDRPGARFLKAAFPSTVEYFSTHPLGEIRMAAVKAYIAKRGFETDLVDLTAKRNPFPLAIRVLKARAKIYAGTLFSRWTPRATGLLAVLAAASATGATDPAFWHGILGTSADLSVLAVPAAGKAVASGALLSLKGIADHALYLFAGAAALVAGKKLFERDNGAARSQRLFANGKEWALAERLKALQREIIAAQTSTAETPLVRSATVLDLMAAAVDLSQEMATQAADPRASAAERRSLSALAEHARGVFADGLELLTAMRGSLKADELVSLRARLLDIFGADRWAVPAPGQPRFPLAANLLVQAAVERWLEKPEGHPKPEPHYIERLVSARRALNDGLRGTSARRKIEIFGDLQDIDSDVPRVQEAFSREFGAMADEIFGSEGMDADLFRRFGRAVKQFAAGNSEGAARVRKRLLQEFESKVPWSSARRAMAARLGLDLSELTSRADSASFQQATELGRAFKDFGTLADWVETHWKAKGVPVEELSHLLANTVLGRPELIAGKADADRLLAATHFWPRINPFNVTEDFFGKALEKVAKKGLRRWGVHPHFSEKLHRVILERLKATGGLPSAIEQKFELWTRMTEVGVSAHSDRLFSEIEAGAPPSLRTALADAGLGEGRIFDPELRSRLAWTQLTGQDWFVSQTGVGREGSIRLAIIYARDVLPERDVHYQSFIERISQTLESSEAESKHLEAAKFPSVGAKDEDLGIRGLSSILNRSLESSPGDQWQVILWLRGEREAPTWVARALNSFGPDRMQTMFRALPRSVQVAMVDGFLSSPSGLLPKADLRGPRARRIVEHLLAQAEPRSREIGSELLEAFLHSLKATGNEPFQSTVLAHLLTFPPDKSASADVLKNILEVFGATGVKIGQFLAASGQLPEAETLALRTLQDRAREPTREAIYADLRKIYGGKSPPFRVKRLLGAASLKYAVLAERLDTGEEVVLKILREDAVAHTRAEFKQLGEMARFLAKKHGPKYGIFRSIVTSARRAVERELELDGEEARSRIARTEIYAGGRFDRPGLIQVTAPQEIRVNPRLMKAHFAPGVGIFDLTPEDRARVAREILSMEAEVLFGDGNRPVIHFDPDRHPGNYRVLVQPGGEIRLSPIDFGQVLPLSRAERDGVIDLFSVAQILKETGKTEWATKRVAERFGLSARDTGRLKAALGKYFPAPDARYETAYYSVLAALDDIGHEVPLVYHDLVRGIAQFRQWEDMVAQATESRVVLRSPTSLFAEAVAARSKEQLAEMKLTLPEKLKYQARIARSLGPVGLAKACGVAVWKRAWRALEWAGSRGAARRY